MELPPEPDPLPWEEYADNHDQHTDLWCPECGVMLYDDPEWHIDNCTACGWTRSGYQEE